MAGTTTTSATTSTPRFFLGIFSSREDDHQLRHIIRRALHLYNNESSLLCSFGSQNGVLSWSSSSSSSSMTSPFPPPSCQVAYTFVVIGDATNSTTTPPHWYDSYNDKNNAKKILQHSLLSDADISQSNVPTEPNDVIRLNIQEHEPQDKTFAWFDYALQVMDTFQWGDYVIKCDERTGLRLDAFLTHTIPSLQSLMTISGSSSSSHHPLLDIYAGHMVPYTFTGAIYMKGEFYMLSRSLAQGVVDAAAAKKKQERDWSSSSSNNSSNNNNNKQPTLLEDQAMGIAIHELYRVIHWMFLPRPRRLSARHGRGDRHRIPKAITTPSIWEYPLEGAAVYERFIEDETNRLHNRSK